jgi:hypothetical protein
MCSNARQPDSAADLATQLAAVIDDLAAAGDDNDVDARRDLAVRLASAWAMITAADPELAARTARYSHS